MIGGPGATFRAPRPVPRRCRLAYGLVLSAGVSGCARDRPLAPSPAFAAADSLRREGRSAEAALRYGTLRDSFAVVHDSANLWRAQLWWGDALTHLGRRDSARSMLDGALALAGADPDRQGWTHHVRSIFFDRQGKFDTAFAEATRAQAAARIARDGLLEGATYHAMGRIHSLTGHYREALDDNTRALALERASVGDTSRAVAVELNELGIDYRHLGRFTDAEGTFERALEFERARRNPEGIARVSANLANVYVAIGDDARALPLMTDALRGAEQTTNVRGEVYVHGDLAELYVRSGDLAAARQHLATGLALNRNGFFAYGRVQSLDALGHVELADRRAGVARAVLDSARRLADSAGFGRERVTSRAGLARAAAMLGEPDAAVAWGSGAVRVADSLGDPDAEVEAREAYAAALDAAGRADALTQYRSTIALLESWRGRLALGDLRMGVAEPRLASYEGAIRILLRQRRVAEAFEVAEHAHARLLLELMAEHAAGAAHSPGEELRERLRERFAEAGDRPVAERPAVEREIAVLTDSLERLDSAARNGDPAHLVRSPAPASLATVQHELLGPGRALVTFFWGDDAVYGWWVSGSAVRAARIGGADSLAALVSFLRDAVDDPTSAAPWAAAAERAYATFIAPLVPDSAGEVLVVPDGPLAYVPLEVFVPRAGALPWGAVRQFAYGPSSAVLTALARATGRATGRANWSRAMLALGDPTPVAAPALADPSARGRAVWDPLPYAAGEARDVAALFQAQGADVLVGADATLDRWRRLQPERYRYLHFAAHATVSERNPEADALVLGGHVLDLPAIRRLDLTSDLVTLSACETGLGRRVRGEGVFGLPHAFLAAGAGGVVVTLWRVTDRSAGDFMRAFYREVRSGSTPAAALLTVRRARLAMAGPMAHPSRWAPFVLVGGVR